MTKTKRIISLALVLVTLMSILSVFTLSAGAVNPKTHYTAKHGMSKYTFTVKTSGKWWQGNASIKFHSAASLQNVGMKAPTMVLSVYDHTSGTTTTKWITGSGDDYYSTLSLKKNRTYTITVSYLNNWSKNSTVWVANPIWTYGYWEITNSTRVKFL